MDGQLSERVVRQPDPDREGGVALVTGGAAGLGRVITTRLRDRGLQVIIADHDAEAGRRTVAELGPAVSYRFCDLLDRDAVRGLVEGIADRPASLRVLVNNAGGWLPGPQFPETDDWARCLELNLHAPMLLTQLALPQLRGGGAVVNIASSGGWDSSAYGSPEYGAAKAGLIRFTTAVADFAERFGVRVSCVVPHWIGLARAVEEYRRMAPEERRRSGGLIDPEVIAATVAKLAADPDAAGRVMIIRPGLEPYTVDPAGYDPHRDVIDEKPDPEAS